MELAFVSEIFKRFNMKIIEHEYLYRNSLIVGKLLHLG